jgi:hypothetical protein
MDVRGRDEQERGLGSDLWRETRQSRSERSCWLAEVKGKDGEQDRELLAGVQRAAKKCIH